jgi:hypothetical protein
MIRSGVRARSRVAQFCVLAAAVFATVGPAAADEKAGEAQPSVSSGGLSGGDLSGRWEGPSYFDTKERENCAGAGGSCLLRLDVVACGDGWCGIELGKEDRCGATALRLDKGKTEPGRASFEGKLELAKGTEPYVVRAFLGSGTPDGKPSLEIIGDTGGEFRMFRRSFPFQTTLVRSGEPHCKPETTVSLAD